MGKRGESNSNLNGLPTALLYLGIFGLIGCCGVLLWGLFTAIFFWVWMWVCDRVGLAAAFPSKFERVLLGMPLYVGLLFFAYAKFRQKSKQKRARRVGD